MSCGYPAIPLSTHYVWQLDCKGIGAPGSQQSLICLCTLTLRKLRHSYGSLFLLSNVSVELAGPGHIQFCLLEQRESEVWCRGSRRTFSYASLRIV